MRGLLRRIKDPLVRKGLVVLLMLAWLLRLFMGLYSLVKGLLSEDDPLVKSFKRREISLINLALSLEKQELNRLRSPCAIVEGTKGHIVKRGRCWMCQVRLRELDRED